MNYTAPHCLCEKSNIFQGHLLWDGAYAIGTFCLKHAKDRIVCDFQWMNTPHPPPQNFQALLTKKIADLIKTCFVAKSTYKYLVFSYHITIRCLKTYFQTWQQFFLPNILNATIMSTYGVKFHIHEKSYAKHSVSLCTQQLLFVEEIVYRGNFTCNIQK